MEEGYHAGVETRSPAQVRGGGSTLTASMLCLSVCLFVCLLCVCLFAKGLYTLLVLLLPCFVSVCW